ncbi:glycosyltransferase family 2 protein [Pseudarthrobacter sp. NPDC058329]|uniref:glycosyltransferase family 2 protein n=1 Tax=Pseudarthrobacter sp. NPDC058329 TaxID=3346448 RepID=UPI0036DB3BDD
MDNPVTGLTASTHRISVVVPVYQGEMTLPGVVAELMELSELQSSPSGHRFVVSEVLLVFDHGPDRSAEVIRELAARYDNVRGVWLSRNFGQHPATLAGMASAGGDWVVTMDEDGQHDPSAIGNMLDTAMAQQSTLVYALPSNRPPHGFLRNAASKGAKKVVATLLSSNDAPNYQSFRLVTGEVARSVAAYAGNAVYLDVALGWIASNVATCPVALREEGDRVSGYRLRTLLSHFWRMVISSGTRGLRLVSLIGAIFAFLGVCLAVYLLIAHLTGHGAGQQGWTSTMIVSLISSGAILFSLGIIAEYVGVNVNMAMGKPAYLIVSDPAVGPLGKLSNDQSSAPQGTASSSGGTT